MGAGLIQLVAYGIEDMFLTNDPQITFFKMVYRRHTPFTKEQIPQNFNGQKPNFGKKLNCTIAKNGDLVGNIFVVVTLPKVNLPSNTLTQFAWVKRVGFALIKSVSIVINGYEIDKHYGHWLNVWSELTGSIVGPQRNGFRKMIGEDEEINEFSKTKDQYQLFIPLQFWFCRSSGLTLPLVSLQYSDIKINVEFEEDKNCYMLAPTHYITCLDDLVSFKQYEYIEQNIDGDIRAGIFINYDINTKRLYYYKISTGKLQSIPVPTGFDVNNPTLVNSVINSSQGQKYAIVGKTSEYSTFSNLTSFSTTVSTTSNLRNLNIVDSFLLVDYYFLDDEERYRFSKAKHDYAIEQLFYTPPIEVDDISRNVQLSIDNPCKAMIWTVQYKYIRDSKDYFNYTDTYQNKVFLNEQFDVPLGYPVGKSMVLKSTILLNGNERLTFRNASYFELLQKYQNIKYSTRPGVNMYSYSLYPFEPVQTSGTFNTSQIDNIQVKLSLVQGVTANNVALFTGFGLCVNIFRIINGLGALVFTK
jgi:Major capsid protein N-terminus/Large eukaryotic DNA virus major capsid protein